MNRREFISTTGATLLSTAIQSERLLAEESKSAAGSGISWHRHETSKLFEVSVEPGFFQALQGASSRAWRMGRRLRLKNEGFRAGGCNGEAGALWLGRARRDQDDLEDVARLGSVAGPFDPTSAVDHGAVQSGRDRAGRNVHGFGLARLPQDSKEQMLGDIASLVNG
jgi:hypothetical protein